jgi:hypothetical protein
VGADIWPAFEGVGAVLAVGVTLGLAVMNLMRGRSDVKHQAQRAARNETDTLEKDVADIKQALAGSENPYDGKRPGIVARLASVETAQVATTDQLTKLTVTIGDLDNYVRQNGNT